jgi:RNA polymerase sigma factor (sigma-70 family)
METMRDRTNDRSGCDRDDMELVNRLREGDLSALAPLFDDHRRGCVQFARRLVGPSDAEDLVSEAFLAMVSAIGNGRGPQRSVRAYLHQAIWSCASRRWSRRDEPVATVLETPSGEALDVWMHEHDHLDQRDELVGAMSTLAPRWRRVLWLVEVEGRSMSEVGDELDIAPSAAAALAYRARKALRAAYLGPPAGGAAAGALEAAA